MKPELKNGIPAFYAKSSKHWRNWLEKNGEKEKIVWLIIYKKDSGTPSVNYRQAVDEALCFGWIDSKPNKRDDKSFYLFFAKRNPKSNWSGINKERVKELIAEGRMHPNGLKMIELAKQTGTWTALENAENLVIPPDLEKQFSKNKKAFENFSAFPKSVKQGILTWIGSAKRAETRQKRIDETVSLAARNIRANQYTPKQ
jgi:uncharacterized protein YdeI (YjbR/CyaY-like superfamily)